MRSAIWAIYLLGLTAFLPVWGTTDDPPPEPKPPEGYKQIVLRTLEYGGDKGLAVSPGRGEGELPAGPAVVFVDSKSRICAYDPVEGMLKRFGLDASKPCEEIEGVVDCSPQVLRVDKQGCIYVYCGDWSGFWWHPDYGVDESDRVNLRKCDPSGKVIYEIGLWDNDADEYALVIYKGGRKKGEPKAIEIEEIVPTELDPQRVYPVTGAGARSGPYRVDSRGNYYWPLRWLTVSGGHEEIAGQGVLKISPSGDKVTRVPSPYVDGKGRYFVLPSLRETPDVELESGLLERAIRVYGEKGDFQGTCTLRLPASGRPENKGRGVHGIWYVDDRSWLYCAEPLSLRPVLELESGVTAHSQYLVHVFNEKGDLVGTGGPILCPDFDGEFEPTVDTSGNIYFLHFRDRDIQVIKWEKMRD